MVENCANFIGAGFSSRLPRRPKLEGDNGGETSSASLLFMMAAMEKLVTLAPALFGGNGGND